MTAAVTIEGASVDYGDVRAVDDVSLEVAPDAVHVLLGHSGSGKTTLLRAIAGFEPLTTGRVLVGGRVVDDGTRAGWVPPEARKVGFVFQDYALFTHLDATGNVAFGVSGSRAERREAAQDWLKRVRLAEHGARKPGELSGGEQQRVALARALAQGPSLVLLDEPFSNLDPQLRREVRDETIDLIRENGAAAVFVTHDVEEAFSVADRLSVLHDGRIEQTGTAEELYSMPATRHVAALCGPATFLKVIDVQGARAGCALGLVDVSGTPAFGTSLVVRPEHLSVSSGGPDRIRHRRFLGAIEELEIELEVGPVVFARVPPGSIKAEWVTVAVVASLAVVE